MYVQHHVGSRVLTPNEIAHLNIENERLVSRTILLIGVTVLLVGLGIVAYGASNFSILSCSSGSCFTPQYLVDQVRADGFRSVYVVSQQEVYGGLLTAVLGLMGVSFWGTQRLRVHQKMTLVLLVGIFLLVLVTAIAIAFGFIPFGQRITV